MWKYGPRGYRYTLLDVGHAIASFCIAVIAAFGENVRVEADAATDEWMCDVLGVSGAMEDLSSDESTVDHREREIPELIMHEYTQYS